MTVFDDMREIRTALERGDVLTESQLIVACEAVLARPAGSTRFATDVIWVQGRRLLAERRALSAALSSALEER